MIRARAVVAGVAWSFAASGLARVAPAQVAQYGYGPGDTVRFAESMEITGVTRGRGGTLSVSVNRDARVALAYITKDSVRAWYDSLRVSLTGPSGTRATPGGAAIGAPFVLRVQPNGIIRTLRAPQLPDPVLQQIAEFAPQFDDLLPLLPAALHDPKSTRTDTVISRTSRDQRTIVIRRIVRTHIERDTTVNNERAVVLGVYTRVHVETTAPWGDQFSARLLLSGTESGIAIVSHAGALIHRTRNGEVRGSTTYRGRGAEVAVPQAYTYRATITARKSE
jgi:hypothetical protein